MPYQSGTGPRRGEDTTPYQLANSDFRTEHHLQNFFVVMYSGNFGLAHPFDAIAAAIDALEHAAAHIVFVLVGAGPRLSWLKERLKDRANVRFLPFQPKGKLGESLAAADLHLASMGENLCGLVVPSKVYGILQAERPCLFVGPKESEAARILSEFKCGTVLACSDHDGLISAILNYATNPDRLNEARMNTRNAMKTNSFANVLSSWEALLPAAMKQFPSPLKSGTKGAGVS